MFCSGLYHFASNLQSYLIIILDVKRSDSKTPRKRKNRSSSRSSSTSSTSSSSRSSYSDKKSTYKRKSEDYISLTDSSNKKGDKKSLLSKKKTLKNIQINNLNGKKSFSFIQDNLSSGKKLSNKLKRNLSFQNENNINSEDSDDLSDEEFMANRKKKLNDRQQRFMKSNKLAERLCYIDEMSPSSKKNVRNTISFKVRIK